MKCVSFIVITILGCVLSEENIPLPFYSGGGKPGNTVVCVEVKQTPYGGGMGKVCGTPVSASRSADNMPFPALRHSQFAFYPMLRAVDSLSMQYANKPYESNYFSPIVMPAYAPKSHRMQGLSRMAEDNVEGPMFDTGGVPLERSNWESSLTFPMSNYRSVMPPTLFYTSEPLRAANMDDDDDDEWPYLPGTELYEQWMKKKEGKKHLRASTNQMSKTRASNTPELTLEQLKKDCEAKDKMIEENQSKIEELRKELSSKMSNGNDVTKVTVNNSEQSTNSQDTTQTKRKK